MKSKKSIVARSFNILAVRDRRKIMGVVIVQILIGSLDLLGVALFGVLGALTISGVSSGKPGNRVQMVISLLNLDSKSLQIQAAVLGLSAAIILISRTLLTIFLIRKTLFFLGSRAANLSADLVSKILAKPLLFVQSRSTQETLYAVTSGVSTVIMGVIGSIVALLTDISLMSVMVIALLIVDPLVASLTIFLFAIVGYAIYKLLHLRAEELGSEFAEISILGSEKIIEVLSSYRETTVRNRRDYYARIIGGIRRRSAVVSAEIQFMPNISKFVLEITVVLSTLTLGAVQFLLQDAIHAAAVLSIFMAAGTRIAPAALRIQQGALYIKGAIGSAEKTLDLIDELQDGQILEPTTDNLDVRHLGFRGSVEIKNVEFGFPGTQTKLFKNLDLKISEGQFVAIVGPSGAGKTTLVDLILGICEPNAGFVKLSNLSPSQAISKWPGAIAYVPQDALLVNGSVAENISLGYPVTSQYSPELRLAAEKAMILDFISTLPHGFETQVGERGTKLSGGQRQRIGIARALYTQPKLIVLDEATSSLDAETEAGISDSLAQLKGEVTMVVIAHRLATVRNADVVIYLESGNILAAGSFEEVRSKIANFDHQARLLGL